jgi:Holliday junction resolvase
MSRHARRVDANQGAVVEALRERGWFVASLASTGRGVPDLLIARKGVMKLIEVKDGAKIPSARKLTTKEALFAFHMQQAGCPVIRVESIADIERYL